MAPAMNGMVYKSGTIYENKKILKTISHLVRVIRQLRLEPIPTLLRVTVENGHKCYHHHYNKTSCNKLYLIQDYIRNKTNIKVYTQVNENETFDK